MASEVHQRPRAAMSCKSDKSHSEGAQSGTGLWAAASMFIPATRSNAFSLLVLMVMIMAMIVGAWIFAFGANTDLTLILNLTRWRLGRSPRATVTARSRPRPSSRLATMRTW